MICQDWSSFLQFVNVKEPQELDISHLHKIIKLPSIKKMSLDELSHYFRQEFQNTRTENRTKWHDQDKYLLIWCVSKCIEKLQIKFQEMTKYKVFPTLSQVLGLQESLIRRKWISLLKQSLKDQPWTEDEDQLLIELRKKYSGPKDWTQITEEFIEQTSTLRYQKQIRERYNNVINPEINKDPFKQEEIFFILQEAKSKKKNWAGISRLLPGRTDNKIKNIYNSTLKKIAKKMELNLKISENEDDILKMIETYQTFDPSEIYNQIEIQKMRKKQCIVKEESLDGVDSIQLPIHGNPILGLQEPFQTQQLQQPHQLYLNFPQPQIPFMCRFGCYYPLVPPYFQQSQQIRYQN